MDRRRLVVAAVTLLAAAGLAFAVAPDPAASPPTVDTDAEPAAVLSQSVTHLRHADYKYVHRRTFLEGEYEGVTVVLVDGTVENSAERHRTVHHDLGENAKVFANDHVGYVSPARSSGWILGPAVAYDRDVANPLAAPSGLDSETVSLANATRGRLRFRITGDAVIDQLLWPMVTDAPGAANQRLTLVVDRETGHLVSLTRTVTGTPNAPDLRETVQFREYGSATANRPDGIGFNLRELLYRIV